MLQSSTSSRSCSTIIFWYCKVRVLLCLVSTGISCSSFHTDLSSFLILTRSALRKSISSSTERGLLISATYSAVCGSELKGIPREDANLSANWDTTSSMTSLNAFSSSSSERSSSSVFSSSLKKKKSSG